MITFVDYTEAAAFFGAGGGTTTLNPSLPTNQTGDVMLAVINVINDDFDGYPTVTAPGGWTLAIDNSTSGTDVRRAVYYKLGDGSTGTITWSFDQPIRGNINLVCYREVNTTTPLDATAVFHNDTGTSTSHPAGSITTVTANALIIGCFFTSDTGVSFGTPPSDLSNIRVNLAGTSGSAERPTLICDGAQAVAGASGTKTAITNIGSLGQEITVALRPAPNPSTPVLTFPNGGESLTAGAVVNVTWTQSTSPTAAQSTLKYNLEYSVNNAVTWVNMVTLTGTGVATYAWTVPATLTTGGLVRIRSNDPAAALFSLGYDQSDSVFSIVAEATPGQPTITAPAVGSVNNKASNVTVSWTHQGGVGNPQVAFTLRWANNVAFTGPTTVGPTTTTTQSTSIDFSGQTSGTTIYLEVKTQGVSIYSAYSNRVSFVVASVPATPNITAPVAASPPTTPLPTITFTEADAFVARKMRVTVAGIETYNSGAVVSSALSFVSPYTFANGVAVVLYLSVKNQYGLASVEDSETLTPAYAGPATPTISLTAVSEAGYILVAITNSDTPTYNEIWRRLATASTGAIRIASGLAKNASFLDYHPISGIGYVYFARAYNALLYKDSANSSTTTLTLTNAFLHSVSRTNTNNNATGAISNLVNLTEQWAREESAQAITLIGRAAPTALLSQPQWQRVTVTAVFTIYTQAAELLALWRTQEDGAVLCFRDQYGNRVFGKMSQPVIQDESTYLGVAFDIIETTYVEAL